MSVNYYDGNLNIANDFIIKNNSNRFVSGTLSIGGNFYQYNNDTVTNNLVQKGTKVKFVGSSVHEIHSQSANTTMSNIMLTNGASISFNGKYPQIQFSL